MLFLDTVDVCMLPPPLYVLDVVITNVMTSVSMAVWMNVVHIVYALGHVCVPRFLLVFPWTVMTQWTYQHVCDNNINVGSK